MSRATLSAQLAVIAMAGHSTGTSSSAPERPKKLQRISQACDLCHRRSIRCRPSAENAQQQCQNCYDFAVECTYNRPSRRRRNQSVSQQSPPNILPTRQHPRLTKPSVSYIASPKSRTCTDTEAHQESPPKASQPDPTTSVDASNERQYSSGPDYTGAFVTVREGRSEDGLAIAWRSFALASLDTIDQLLVIYMDVVYPIFPLFHGPTLWERIRRRDHLFDRGFFASIMAACALASARARDGALNEYHTFRKNGPEQQSEIFYSAASDAIFKDLNKAQGLGFLRACGLLAMTSIQYGQIASMHQYLGHFCTLSAMQQFHDETHWPQSISLVEKEERRRLYWSMYSMDVLSAVVFNGVMKFQETSANVQYPTEVDDDKLTATSCYTAVSEHWLQGWNFTTDLYRVLEHTINRVRRNHVHREDRPSVTRLLVNDEYSDAQVMDNIMGLYYGLPDCFKQYTVQVTGNRGEDLYGFQAANIQATLQLVRMTLFSVNPMNDVYQKCQVAEQLLSTFHSICPRFLHAISTPLVYHLGGIGHILASVMEGLLTEDSYQRVRSLLGSMADLLEGLESGLQPTAGASKGLRAQIDKIDQYMLAQRRLMPNILDPQNAVMAGPGAQRAGYGGNPYPQQVDGYHVQPALNEFHLPQDVVGQWPWPFDLHNGTSHHDTHLQGFIG